MLVTKLVSSLEKPFLDSSLSDYPSLESLSALQHERVHFQVLYTLSEPVSRSVRLHVRCDAPVSVTLRALDSVPVRFPIYPFVQDPQYLRRTPGLYPDCLSPLQYDSTVAALYGQLQSVWVTLDTADLSGSYEISVSFSDNSGAEVSVQKLTLTVVGTALPEPPLYFTEWFHLDCIARWHHTDMFSEQHWELIEKYLSVAVRNGINTILTPVLTPPLDTEVGWQRPNAQLADIRLDNGTYTFDFAKLDRWVALCRSLGIRAYEISHLFSQWGAAHAPEIYAIVDGESKRIFGFDTDALNEPAYPNFLASFLPALTAHLSKLGILQSCFFHISDEPNLSCLENYKKAQSLVLPYLEGCPIIDAMSDVELYTSGISRLPVSSTNVIHRFIDAGAAPNLWAYYCCGEHTAVSNRYIAMPSVRTRCISAQLFKYHIQGFLHWGFNFFFNMGSRDLVNPYLDGSGGTWVPAGDAFQVYPSPDGNPLESIRLTIFHDALQDIAAFSLCASMYGHERVVKELEDILGIIRFDICPSSPQVFLKARMRINELISAGLAAR